MRRSCPEFRVLATWTLGAVATIAAAMLACELPGSYVYSARKFDPDAECLDPYAPLDLIQADAPSSSCEPACLTYGPDLFVSSVCAPFPLGASAVAADASACMRAVAALDAGRTCESSRPSDGDLPGDAARADDANGVGDADRTEDAGVHADARDVDGTADSGDSGAPNDAM